MTQKIEKMKKANSDCHIHEKNNTSFHKCKPYDL